MGKMSIWFDKKGDFLELSIDGKRKGFFKDVGNDMFERVDTRGNVTGFGIFNFTKRALKEEKVTLPIELKIIRKK